MTRVSIRYPWVDTNHDTFVQPGEIIIPGGNIANYLALTGNWNPAAPGSPTTANTVDPNLKNDRTDEIILGVDREVGAGFAVGANYIWRRYTNFQFTDTLGLEPSDYVATTFTPAASTCPGADGNRISAGNCPTVTMYQPLVPGAVHLAAHELQHRISTTGRSTASSSRRASGCRITG